jgi:hypothetical protein
MPPSDHIPDKGRVTIRPSLARAERELECAPDIQPVPNVVIGAGPIGAPVRWILRNGTVRAAIVGCIVHTVRPAQLALTNKPCEKRFSKTVCSDWNSELPVDSKIRNRRNVRELRIVWRTGLGAG